MTIAVIYISFNRHFSAAVTNVGSNDNTSFHNSAGKCSPPAALLPAAQGAAHPPQLSDANALPEIHEIPLTPTPSYSDCALAPLPAPLPLDHAVLFPLGKDTPAEQDLTSPRGLGHGAHDSQQQLLHHFPEPDPILSDALEEKEERPWSRTRLLWEQFRDTCYLVQASAVFQHFTTAMIICNAIVLALVWWVGGKCRSCWVPCQRRLPCLAGWPFWPGWQLEGKPQAQIQGIWLTLVLPIAAAHDQERDAGVCGSRH